MDKAMGSELAIVTAELEQAREVHQKLEAEVIAQRRSAADARVRNKQHHKPPHEWEYQIRYTPV